MDNLYLVLTAFPLVGVNIWHSILLAMRSRHGKLHTISEHATDTPRLLQIHRIVHTVSGAAFIFFAFGYLWPHGYELMAVILFAGGIFDAAESYVLDRHSAKQPAFIGAHQRGAWMMAVCYLMYGIFIANVSGLNPWFTNSVWLLFVILFAVSVHSKFQYFWAIQMTFFVLMGLIIGAAHLTLLTW